MSGANTDAPTVRDAVGTDVIGRARSAAAVVDAIADDARASIPGWDNLAYVNAFTDAAERARDVLRTSTHPVERRLVGARLLRLMPLALVPEAFRQRTVTLSLPDAVLQRADNDFALNRDDTPRVHPSWTASLLTPGLKSSVLRPGRHEWLLAPRSFSPKDATGSTMLVRVVGSSLGSSDELCQLEIKNPGGHTSRRRRTSDGKDAGPAELRADVLKSWLVHGGPSCRGLDLRRADDRCLWLTYQETLRERRLDTLLARPAGHDGERRADIISALIDAAIDAVAFSALDPLACRFVLPTSVSAPWIDLAIKRLVDVGLGAEVMPLRPTTQTRELVWLDAIVDAGFVGGAMSDVAQARALSRLVVSALSPLGVLPMVGARCGRGVVLTIIDDDPRGPRQRGPLWAEPASETPLLPLWEAWARGAGRFLPAPTPETAHDIASLPAFLEAFADVVAGSADDAAAAAASDRDVNVIDEHDAGAVAVAGVVDDSDVIGDNDIIDDDATTPPTPTEVP
jgi:hypothetical protein